jgi:hypothetical protein
MRAKVQRSGARGAHDILNDALVSNRRSML